MATKKRKEESKYAGERELPLTPMRNPQDQTVRNTQASNKRDAKMKAEMKDLKRRIKAVENLLRRVTGEILG